MTTTKNNEHKNIKVPNLRFPEFQGEWKESTIGEMFDLYSGNTPSRLNKEHFTGTVNWISSGELKEHYIYSSKEQISEEAAKSLKLLPVGTFVIAIYGLEAEGVKGTGSIIQEPSTISQACMSFIPKGVIENEFLYSWYKKHGNVIGIRYAQGTKQQNLSYDILEKFMIAYPNTKEQEKLNKFISLLDERITTQNKVIDKLQSLIKGINQRVFMNNGINYKLGEISEIRSGYSGNQLLSKKGLKVSRIETISGHKVNLERVGYVAPFESSENYKLQVGDILFSNINSVEYIGNTAFIDKDYDLYHGMNLLRLTPNNMVVIPFYLYLLLNTNRMLNRFKTVCNKAVSQASINQTELGKTVVQIPSINNQKQICELYQALYTKLETESNTKSLFQNQKQYLLRQMFI
ncbi:restriction endonuclease subunit S [Prevotella sp.]|uniref:restriction endonuclease subunit S n=1 Tax=Prevotella sp. TaxID=59823 RepID=UPI003AF7095A